eukprot:XP_011447504.1 PREDICTED: vegetative cell wall protein gp1-like [Crassostrea gigas]
MLSCPPWREARKRTGLGESGPLASTISPRTRSFTGGRCCNDGEEAAGAVSPSTPSPPPPPAPRVRGPASIFRRVRSVARRAMPYRTGGPGVRFSLPPQTTRMPIVILDSPESPDPSPPASPGGDSPVSPGYSPAPSLQGSPLRPAPHLPAPPP